MAKLPLADVEIDITARVRHEHWARLHGQGKWGFDSQPRDDWQPVAELRVSAKGGGKGVPLSSTVGATCADKQAAQHIVDALTVEHCPHPSGKALVFRIAGAAPKAFRVDETPLTVGEWRAVYVGATTVALAGQRLAPSAAADCTTAAARFPDPMVWLAQELSAKADETEEGSVRQVAVRGGTALRHAQGTELESSVGFLVAVEEGLLLEQAFDWALRHNQHGRADDFARYVAKRTAAGPSALERHVLRRLAPHAGAPFLCPLQDAALDRVVLATSDATLQREATEQVATACKQQDTSKLCHSWRVRNAAALAGRLTDPALCDRLLATMPMLEAYWPKVDVECAGESVDVTRQLALLRGAHRCGTADGVYQAALAALSLAPLHGHTVEHCEFDAKRPGPNDECNELSLYAAAILATRCRPDTARAAAKQVDATEWWAQRMAALCVVGRCGDRAAFREAATASGMARSELESAVSDCGIDPAWLPPKGAAPSVAAPSPPTATAAP